ncbi:MAG: alpha/beta hydrolase, partial [Gemmatimonadota bacterium]
GYPGSDPGPIPRHSRRIAQELHAALHGAEVGGPYLLVGHSIGGLNVQVFFARYPGETAGLVLLDPPPLSWITGEGYSGLREMAGGVTEEWENEAARLKEEANAEAHIQALFLETLASEHREMFGASAREAAAIGSFGALPTLVFASGRSNPGFGEVAQEYQRFWAGESLALSRKSTEGELILVEDSSHNLHADAPEQVIQGILRTLGKARRLGRLPGRSGS